MIINYTNINKNPFPFGPIKYQEHLPAITTCRDRSYIYLTHEVPPNEIKWIGTDIEDAFQNETPKHEEVFNLHFIIERDWDEITVSLDNPAVESLKPLQIECLEGGRDLGYVPASLLKHIALGLIYGYLLGVDYE